MPLTVHSIWRAPADGARNALLRCMRTGPARPTVALVWPRRVSGTAATRVARHAAAAAARAGRRGRGVEVPPRPTLVLSLPLFSGASPRRAAPERARGRRKHPASKASPRSRTCQGGGHAVCC
jgi:hypothetical protein